MALVCLDNLHIPVARFFLILDAIQYITEIIIKLYTFIITNFLFCLLLCLWLNLLNLVTISVLSCFLVRLRALVFRNSFFELGFCTADFTALSISDLFTG